MPDRTYLESWGYDVNSPGFGMPVVSSQQPIVMPVFDAHATGDVILAAAKGIPAAAKALPWPDEVAFLKEAILKLPPGAAGGSGQDVLWSRFLQNGGWWPASYTPQAVKTSPAIQIQVAAPTFQGDENEYPYFLYLYQSDYLSDGRGASLPWLQGSPDPMTSISWQTWVEINSETAKKLGVNDGDVVQVTSQYGLIEAPVYVYPAIRPDTIAIPVGQGHTDLGRYAKNHGNRPIDLVGMKADASGASLAWSNVRVMVTRTGKRVKLAAFDNKIGITQGLPNESFPGQ